MLKPNIILANLNSFIRPTLSGMAIVGALICSFIIVYSGIKYITSSGHPDKLAEAKSGLIKALVGLSIIIGASALSLILIHGYSAVANRNISQLPALQAIKPVKASNGLIAIIIDAITGVLSVIVKSIAQPFIGALNYFVSSTPVLAHNPSVFHLWLITSAIADSLLVLVIALIGFHVMAGEQLGLKSVSLRNLLPQVIFTFILMNSSIFILDGIIELSNAMIATVNSVTGNLSPWKTLALLSTNLSGYSLAALLIFLIFVIFSAILIIYYITRLVTLYIGAVLSPLVILMSLVPGFREFSENAFKAYVSTIFIIFIHVIILSLAGSLFLGLIVSGNGQPNPIMSLLLGLATLIALLKTPGVLRQLNYAAIGPRMVKRLGGSFVGGISTLGASLKYATTETYLAYQQDRGNLRSNLPLKNSSANNSKFKSK